MIELQHPQVRDLAWCLFSAPLMAGLDGIPVDERAPGAAARHWLRHLDQRPAALLQHLETRPSRRLGIYFENLLSFFYQSSLCRRHDRLELRAQNLQVAVDGRTLGEFDFLLHSTVSDHAIHVETAVKFYLGTPDPETAGTASARHQWLGPGCRDRLDLKLTHLAQRQLQLSQLPAAAARLHALHLTPELVKPLALLRGVLLYPGHAPMNPPAGAHADHQRGKWFYLRDFLTRESDAAWEWLPRLRWLAPTRFGEAGVCTTGRARHLLCDHFARQRQPVMLREHKSAADPALLMVVPDYWPWTT